MGKKVKEKVSTTNKLAEEFQINEGVDPNHIFPKEYEMINELKEAVPDCAELSDKYLATLLFSRRHKMDEVIEVTRKFMELKKERQPKGEEIESVSQEMKSVSQEMKSVLFPAPGQDLLGRRIVYFRGSHMSIPHTPPAQSFKHLLIDTDNSVENETLATLRNGQINIMDLKGFGLKNMDNSSEGRKFTNSITGATPKRIRKMYIINAPKIMTIILKFAKKIMPKKLTKRVEVISVEDLKKYLPEDQILVKYGGTLDLDFVCSDDEEIIQDIEEVEDISNTELD